MAQHSARRGWKNQANSERFERANVDPVRELPYRPAAFMLYPEAGQMAAFDYVSIASKNRLRRPGRPQMSLNRIGSWFTHQAQILDPKCLGDRPHVRLPETALTLPVPCEFCSNPQRASGFVDCVWIISPASWVTTIRASSPVRA